MLTRRQFLGMSLAACLKPSILAQKRTTFVGEEVFERILVKVKPGPIGKTAAAVAMELLGTPYVGATLELDDRVESCSVNLLGLDCVTLYETSLCFARMLRHDGRTPADLLREIQFTRYRGGKLDGYLSRLHYTSDWIYDNARKAVVHD